MLAVFLTGCSSVSDVGANETGSEGDLETAGDTDSPGTGYEGESTTGDPSETDDGSGGGSQGGSGEDTGGGPSAPQFVNATREAGLDYVQYEPGRNQECVYYDRSRTYYRCSVDRNSGGAAAGDFDGDGHVDLFVTRYENTDILFRNRGDGTFDDVSASAGFNANERTNGAAWVDADNDGDLDLYVTGIGTSQHFLYINDGEGGFTEEAMARGAGIDTGTTHSGTSVAVGDYDRDGWPDLYVAEWRFSRFEVVEQAPNNNRLLRNLGPDDPGHFEDVTDRAGVAIESSRSESHDGVFAYGPAFVDLDGDGWQDLAVAADFGTSALFWNQHDGTFVEQTVESGVGLDEYGMGSTFGDVDKNGHLDWFVTSIGPYPGYVDEERVQHGNVLYMNRGSRWFDEVSDELGVWDGSWGWGAAFLDHDNDGDLDVVMTNGVDDPTITYAIQYRSDPIRFWRNDGPGPWTEVASELGVDDRGNGKGLLTWDPDGDGDMDLFVVNNAEPAVFYRNDLADESHWLRVQVIDPETGGTALGARLVVERVDGTRELKEVGADAHFLAQSEPTAHFGLGTSAAPVPSVEVTWPRLGLTTTLRDVAPDQLLVIQPPSDTDPP